MTRPLNSGFFMGYRLSKRSRDRLKHVHPDIVLVVGRAIQISTVDFGVLEGARLLERQKELVLSGKSKTLDSRHLLDRFGIAHAVDLFAFVEGNVTWEWKYYEEIARAMKQAASELEIEIEWGGDWKSFKDGVHFQRPRNLN